MTEEETDIDEIEAEIEHHRQKIEDLTERKFELFEQSQPEYV